MEKNNLTAQQKYADRKIKFAMMGIGMAFISAISLVTFQNFNATAQNIVYSEYDTGPATNFMLCLMLLSLCECTCRIIIAIFSKVRNGIPFREYGRLWNVKSSRIVLVSALVAGPVATACTVSAVTYAGSTYTNIILTLTVVLIAIGGRIFLKENTNARMFLGVILVLAGCAVASWSKPEAIESGAFYLGIMLALAAAVGFAVEAIISTHAMDVSDTLELCAMYRATGGAVLELSIALIFAAITGNLDIFGQALSFVFHTPAVMLFLLLTGIAMSFQYGLGYTCFNYCGAVRGNVIIYTTPIWSIPIGIIFTKIGLLDYQVTTLGVIGAFVVVLGVIVVNCKPSELFNLRKM